jgi:hypothetical protein
MLANALANRKLDLAVNGRLGFATAFGEISLPLKLGEAP